MKSCDTCCELPHARIAGITNFGTAKMLQAKSCINGNTLSVVPAWKTETNQMPWASIN